MCPNCGTPLVEGPQHPFCPSCGQNNSRPRLEAKAVLLDAFQSFVGWDSALANTVGGLFKNPGRLVANYVKGRRRYYVNPARFCLLTSAFWYLAMQLADLDTMAASGISITGSSSDAAADLAGRIRDFIGRNLELMQYLSLPLLAGALRLTFRKAGRNLAECLVFVMFLYGFRFLMSLVAVPFAFLHPEAIQWRRYVFGLGWTIWAAKTFFGVGVWSTLWRTTTAMFLHFFGTILLFALIAVPWVMMTM